MKIIILGNGFDLANGLPTKFLNFFEYRINDMRYEFRELKRIFKFSQSLSKNEEYDEYSSLLEKLSSEDVFRTNYSELIDRKHELEQILNEKIKDEFYKVLICKSKDLSRLKQNGLTFWDIFFFALKENKHNITDWNNFEQCIRDFVVKKKSSERYTMGKKLSKINYNDLIPNVNLNHRRIKENLFIKLSDENKENIILYEFISGLKKHYNNQNYDLVLLEELKLFENIFRNYIDYGIMEKLNNSKRSQSIYRDNLLRLVENDMENDYLLFNFNYTLFSNSRDDLKKSKVSISRNNENVSFNENNVHGRYDRLCIFGIDQTKIHADSPEYIFTKTYRKLDSYDQLITFSLPTRLNMKEIIFYGHSLSEADYSYFQSIFDYYNIYQSDVRIKFMYSLYGEKSNHSKIKSDQISAITRLLQDYGKTMNNKDHGKNLIHKLLIENRLLIKKIELVEIPGFKSSIYI
jgi:hypothetical protein